MTKQQPTGTAIFMHKDIAIELISTGNFRAVLGGKAQVTSSLAAMKKRIDDAEKSSFKPFKCLARINYGNEYEEVEVVGIETQRRRGIARKQFILKSGQRTPSVLELTDANKKALKTWEEYNKETKRIAQERSEKGDELWEAMKDIEADSFTDK